MKISATAFLLLSVGGLMPCPTRLEAADQKEEADKAAIKKDLEKLESEWAFGTAAPGRRTGTWVVVQFGFLLPAITGNRGQTVPLPELELPPAEVRSEA